MEPSGLSTIEEAWNGVNGFLATLNNAQEQDHVMGLLSSYGDRMYAIGLKDDQWADGSTSSYRGIGQFCLVS